MSTTRTVEVTTVDEDEDEWPGEKGFRQEVDLSKGPEAFDDGDVVPKPGYHGTETWVFPAKWAPDHEAEEEQR